MNNIGKVGEIRITEFLKKQIDYYHKQVGSTEWSGILFYKHIGGDISKLKDLVFEAFAFYLMDIGSHAYTEFEYDSQIVNAYTLIPDAMESNTGIIHTHHSMTTFFSGTDTKELEDNAGKYNYFISLIVAFNDKYAAKIAIPAKTTYNCKSTIKDTNGNNVEVITEKIAEEILVGDLDIVMPEESIIEEWVAKRYTEVKEAKAKKIAPKPYTSNSYGRHASYGARNYSYDDDPYGYTGYNRGYQQSKTVPIASNQNTLDFREAKVDPLTKFLGCVLNLDVEYDSETSIESLVSDLNKIGEEDVDIYLGFIEEVLEMNIDLMYQYAFGTSNNYIFNLKRALNVLKELNKNKEYSGPVLEKFISFIEMTVETEEEVVI